MQVDSTAPGWNHQFLGATCFFPTCQVRVAEPQLPAPDGSVSPPELSRQLPTAEFSAGPQLPAPDGSVPRRLPTAEFSAGPRLPAPDGSVPRLTSTAS